MKVTDEFNQLLNKWKNQFMSKLFAEVLGGPGKGSSTGGQGDEGSGGGTRDESEDKNGKGSGMGKGGGKGEEKKKGSRMPIVLLSGMEDPDFPGVFGIFTDRHNAVEQRQQDIDRGIYWINLEKPMAKKIISKYGKESMLWRNYIFQRHVDIIVMAVISRFAKNEGGLLSRDQIDSKLMEVSSLVYDKASEDLEKLLLDEKYSLGINNEKEVEK